MSHHDKYERLLNALDRQAPWDGPGLLFCEFGDSQLVYMFPIPDIEVLPSVAAAWRDGKIERLREIDRLVLVFSGIRGDDTEQRVMRELVAISKDAEFTVLLMDHDTKVIVEYDAMGDTDIAMDGMRQVGAAAWPLN
jgi:hypothetical protein